MVANYPLPQLAERGRMFTQTLPVTDDVYGMRILMANIYFVGRPEDGSWVLVDTGLWYAGNEIIATAERRFGAGSRPRAIILTHGHFDHVGTVRELSERWNVPVYAHELELPYLTGRENYPPPDPTVGGGLMAWTSFIYPSQAIDLGDRVRPLPADGSVPEMPGWRWIHTPGHSPGHVSLFRDSDRAVIAGDAFITTDQESALSVLTQHQVIHGPPAYFTTDWEAARESVRLLADLHPQYAATGHGVPMAGWRLDRDLQLLARDFDTIAVPSRGRYVQFPGRGPRGVEPQAPTLSPGKLLAVIGIAAGAALLANSLRERRRMD